MEIPKRKKFFSNAYKSQMNFGVKKKMSLVV